MREDQWKHDHWMGCRYVFYTWQSMNIGNWGTSQLLIATRGGWTLTAGDRFPNVNSCFKKAWQNIISSIELKCHKKCSQNLILLFSGPSPINSGPNLDLPPPRPGNHRARDPPAWWARHPQDPQDPRDLGGPRNAWDGEERHGAGELDQDGRLHGGHLAVHLDLEIYIVPKRYIWIYIVPPGSIYI